MAQILRWALTQPGFETVFTRREMYIMPPTNVQPVTRYFSQQDAMRIGSSRYYVPSIQGAKIGYTNIARYSYVCLAEQNGMRLICVTMESQLKPDKYRDVKALLEYAFSTWTGDTALPEGTASAALEVAGGGGTLGTVTVLSPGVELPLAPGLTAQDVTVELELPARYLLGSPPEVTAVYTVQGGTAQQTASIRLPARIQGLEELLAQNTGLELGSNQDLMPRGIPWGVVGTVLLAAAGAAALWLRVRARPRGRSRRRH